jgi:hypothetical protein
MSAIGATLNSVRRCDLPEALRPLLFFVPIGKPGSLLSAPTGCTFWHCWQYGPRFEFPRRIPSTFPEPHFAMAGKTNEPKGKDRSWTFLTNHSHVLICIHEDSSIRTRDVAARVGITERAVHRIISELSSAGYLSRTRVGRRNRYRVCADQPLRHPVEAHCLLSSLLKTVKQSNAA